MTTTSTVDEDAVGYDGNNYVIAAACAFSIMLALILIVKVFCKKKYYLITKEDEIEKEKNKSKLYETVLSILDINKDFTMKWTTTAIPRLVGQILWAIVQCAVSVSFLVLLSITFVNFYKDDDNVPDKTEDMRSLSKFFVSVQFLLMVKAIDRTVDTGVKLSHTKAIYVRDCGWQTFFHCCANFSNFSIFVLCHDCSSSN